ncbi:MAG: M20/M25/M40 family metallo-hydrolase [Candidatus Methanomethylicaceae archaeon]
MRKSKQELIGSLNHDELTKLCSELIMLGGENPPGNTTKIADYIKQRLANKGITVKLYEPVKNMPNLVCSIGSGKPRLVLCGHLDVFPVGHNWSFDPFCGKLVDGKILGRGAVDMKAGVASAITCIESLLKYENRLNGTLTLALFSDEENMGFGGAQWMLENVSEVRGDACFIGEPARSDVITLGEKGVLWLKLSAEGELAHGAYAHDDNAVIKLIKTVLMIEDLKKITN